MEAASGSCRPASGHSRAGPGRAGRTRVSGFLLNVFGLPLLDPLLVLRRDRVLAGLLEHAGRQVPLADEAGAVSGIPEHAGDAAFAGIDLDPVDDHAGVRGVTAGLQHAAVRRAERTGRKSIV